MYRYQCVICACFFPSHAYKLVSAPAVISSPTGIYVYTQSAASASDPDTSADETMVTRHCARRSINSDFSVRVCIAVRALTSKYCK